MKILLEYDPSTGQITYDNMTPLCIWMGLNHLEYKGGENGETDKSSEVVKLVSMGITADDLLKLKANGIV